MIMDYANKTITLKIVYTGMACAGKTESLKWLFSHFNKSEELHSIETTTGRTLFFDFGMLEFSGTSWNLKILLYTATGQDYYAATRPSTLYGVDGIIFIIDSQKQHLDDNLRYWEELKCYFPNQFSSIPKVICFNKWDLENKIQSRELMERIIPGNDQDATNYAHVETIATQGVGVLESFNLIIEKIIGINLLVEKEVNG